MLNEGLSIVINEYFIHLFVCACEQFSDHDQLSWIRGEKHRKRNHIIAVYTFPIAF